MPASGPSAISAENRSALKSLVDTTCAEMPPANGMPLTSTTSDGARAVPISPSRTPLMSVSLLRDAAGGSRVGVRQQQRDHAGQERVVDVVELRDADPLRRVAELDRGDAVQVAAGDCDGAHSGARIGHVDRGAAEIGNGRRESREL